MFSDNEDEEKDISEAKVVKNKGRKHKSTLFDDDNDDSDGEINIEIKKQFEGEKGQKVNVLSTIITI